MKTRTHGRPLEFKEVMKDFTTFDFTVIRATKVKYRMANQLVNYFGWKAYPKENRISKQSKINNHDQARQENQY